MNGVLTPAYGRVYNTQEEVEEAYFGGKDFLYHNPSSRYDGKYCSCRDFPNEPMQIRYGTKHLTKVTVLTWSE